MKCYRILCRVSGGVTGTREAYLKGKEGREQIFSTRQEAEAEAKRLNERMNNMHSSAYFRYTVE